MSRPLLHHIRRGLVAGIVLLSTIANPAGLQAVSPVSSLVITEVQTGGIIADAENAKAEFVELFNPLATSVQVDGWQLQFLTKDHDGQAPPTRILASLSGSVAAGSYLLVSYDNYLVDAEYHFSGGPSSGYLAKADGTVRLADAQGVVHDMVGYGAALQKVGESAQAPAAGNSLQRCETEGQIVHTANNAVDFSVYSQATPRQSTPCPIAEEPESPAPEPGLPPEPEPTPEEEVPPSAGLSCEGIVISELLPNPKGADASQEFIELHNPTDEVISLSDCTLQTSANSKQFALAATELQPGEHKTWLGSQTGLTLPNSAGGTVWLLAPQAELQAVTYPGNLADDVAWAYFAADQWQATYTPTPNATNVFTETKPCPDGQMRNQQSGRCTAIASADSVAGAFAPCAPGQERNPATNRCRSTVTAVARTLSACAPGQFRNPETNRCKKIEGASTELQPCPEGQERNPATNRCRKATSNADAGTIKDIPSGPGAPMYGWWLAGLGLVGIAGYGLYEWRHEIGNGLTKLKAKLLPVSRE